MPLGPVGKFIPRLEAVAERPIQGVVNHLEALRIVAPQADVDRFVSNAIPKGSLIGRLHQAFLGETVSREHALLSQDGILRDLGSRRGTFVNGKLVDSQVKLKPSDVVRLGRDPQHYYFDGEQLIPKSTTIGRNSGHDFVVPDESVSRNHARISPNGMITDLNSTSGILVDGKRVNGSQQLENGSLITLGSQGQTHFYYNHGKIHPLTPQKANLLQQLFPDGLAPSNFNQGAIGNCTFLSSLKAMLHNNPARFIDLMEPLPNGKIQFSFQGNTISPLELGIDEFKSRGVQGPLGVRLLETAFGRHLKNASGYDRYLALGQGLNTIQVLDEGGYADKALKALTSGKETSMVYNNGEVLGKNAYTQAQTLAHLNQIEKDPTNRIAVASAGIANPKKGLVANHAYSVLHVDNDKNMVTLANPHHSKIPLNFSLDEFLGYFRRLTVATP